MLIIHLPAGSIFWAFKAEAPKKEQSRAVSLTRLRNTILLNHHTASTAY